MKIEKQFGITGAQKAMGTTIIIDIFRAATVDAFLLDKKVDYIIPVSTKEDAFSLKAKHPDYILLGENRGFKIEGFDIGNSPFEISQLNLNGKVVVHRSSQGTQGIVGATHAETILFGSFVSATAIINYLKEECPAHISVIAMDGENSEDDIFADYLMEKLVGKNNTDMPTIVNFLKTHPGAARFLDPHIPEFPREDFDLCLDLDRFDFFPLVVRENDTLQIVKSQ